MADSCLNRLSNIAKRGSIVSLAEMKRIIQALVSSLLGYNNSLRCLQLVQNAAVKLRIKSSKTSHVTPVFLYTGFPSNSESSSRFLTFGAWRGQAPANIKMVLPPFRTVFEVVAPKLWNSHTGLGIYGHSTFYSFSVLFHLFLFLAWWLHLMSVALPFICSFVFYCEPISSL